MRPSSLALVFLVTAGGCAADPGAAGDTALPVTSPASGTTGRSRHFALGYEATVKSAPDGSKVVDLWLPVAQDSDYQKVDLIDVTSPAPHELNVEPTSGNRILHVRVPASSLPLTVKVNYDVIRQERKEPLGGESDARLPAAERERFLAGTPLVPVGESVTKMTGFESTGGDPIAVARQAYDHVLAKMKYDKPANSGWGKGSTEWACSAGFGNCTDFHAYFMSLARTHKIPARFWMGISIPTDKTEGEIPGYHCWAEFFADGRGWVPVDISDADRIVAQKPEMADFYFGGLTMDRIELSLGRDVMLAPKQAGPPLNFFVYPYCEIDGKEAPKEAIARKFTFKDA